MTSVARARGRVSREKLWMWLCVLVIVVVAATWIPALSLPLGDDHQGRILGRMVLHADNFLDRGWSGSNYVADWLPYSELPYAHHPPLPQFLHAAVGWVQGGATALGARMIDFVGGIVAVVLLTWFVRRLTGSWMPAALAAGGLAVSGYFWLFGRSLGLMFITGFFLVHLFARQRPGRLASSLLFAVAVLGSVQSWQAASVIGLLAVYDFFTGTRKQSLVIAAGVALGFAMDIWWIEAAAGIEALLGHLNARAQAANYGFVPWFDRQRIFLFRFERLPVVLAALVGVIAGLVDRRFRPYMGASLVSVIVFAVAFHQNAWVHEYWNWRFALILALGMGAMGSALSARFGRSRWLIAVMVVTAIVLAVAPILHLGSRNYSDQYVNPAQAGVLVERNPLPESQTFAWHYGGIAGPRWLSWYTGLPERRFDPENPPGLDAIVLVRRPSDYGLADVETVDSLGDYALVTSGDLHTTLMGG